MTPKNVLVIIGLALIAVAGLWNGSAIQRCMVKLMRVQQKPGMVIVLNGPSASGKSSIQRAFQQIMMPQLWIKLGIDSLFDAPMPDITPENMHVWQVPNAIRWVESTKDAEGNPVISLHTGAEGEHVAYGMNRAIAAYAREGCNVIVDYIAYKKAWLDDLRDQLRDIPACWVKVHLPLSAIEARETARGTSPRGHARSHYDTVFWDVAYDLDLDTSSGSAQELAERLKEYVARKGPVIA